MSEFEKGKYLFGVNAWKLWVMQKNNQIAESDTPNRFLNSRLLEIPPDELNDGLSKFLVEARTPQGIPYSATSMYYLCLGIQKYFLNNGRVDRIFWDPYYEQFTEILHDRLQREDPTSSYEANPPRVFKEIVLWEAHHLGAHSPYDLLNTVMYFNTKYFKLKSTDDHVRIYFSQMSIVSLKRPNMQDEIQALRYYPNGKRCQNVECSHNTHECIDGPRENPNENQYVELRCSEDGLKCPVRTYTFYVSKCIDAYTGRNDVFYFYPERNPNFDGKWFTSRPLDRHVIHKMIQRFKSINEIQEQVYQRW